ncbi:hypothetical protein NE562_16065, partial [Butyricicoccus faecihominis]|uniref:hypothetical protein n=1 Tax=Butyricicoccus faecihominis TaxID=1712515 RepID=UPI0024790629
PFVTRLRRAPPSPRRGKARSRALLKCTHMPSLGEARRAYAAHEGNNRFAPKDPATHAEAAAVLRRFVEIVIDPAAAGGWKQIDGTWHYFDGSGLMQAGGWQEISGK